MGLASTTLRTLSVALLLSVSACGGKVVFEPTDATSSSSSSTSTSSGGPDYWTPKSSGGCLLQPPIGAITACGNSSNDGSTCVTSLCDSMGNTFVATCSGKSCSCSWNGNAACTCDTSDGDFCAGTPICCH